MKILVDSLGAETVKKVVTVFLLLLKQLQIFEDLKSNSVTGN